MGFKLQQFVIIFKAAWVLFKGYLAQLFYIGENTLLKCNILRFNVISFENLFTIRVFLVRISSRLFPLPLLLHQVEDIDVVIKFNETQKGKELGHNGFLEISHNSECATVV